MNTLPSASAAVPASTHPPETQRLMSLDVFRGATIAAMMLVNNPGSWNAVHKQLDHAEWNGWTFTDLVFPFFLWIVGAAIPFSTGRRLEQGQSRGQLFLHVLRRAAIIFALGFSLNSLSVLLDASLWGDGFRGWCHSYATSVRVPGVLQRIALCYLLASLIYLRASVRGQVLWVLGLLAGYWALMTLVPVPGHGAGILEKEGNFSQYVDNLVLNGPVIGTHVWKGGKIWDPEGIISTIPAIATCLLGILAGTLLRAKLIAEAKAAWLLSAGALLLFAGTVMDVWLPINKNLWTSSYSVFMAGMAAVCFGVAYWFIDVQGWRKWAKPFAIYGMNAITMFVLAGVEGRLSLVLRLTNAAGRKVPLNSFLYEKLFGSFASPNTAPCCAFLASPENASLMWALLYMTSLYLVAWLMYRQKWFVKF
jgi:predicted acyltransferase